MENTAVQYALMVEELELLEEALDKMRRLSRESLPSCLRLNRLLQLICSNRAEKRIGDNEPNANCRVLCSVLHFSRTLKLACHFKYTKFPLHIYSSTCVAHGIVQCDR